MRWLLFLVALAACNRHLSSTGEEGVAATGSGIRTTSVAIDGGIDFVCPSQPLSEGTACTLPPNERCKYFLGGVWRCLVCDKSGHWLVVHC